MSFKKLPIHTIIIAQRIRFANTFSQQNCQISTFFHHFDHSVPFSSAPWASPDFRCVQSMQWTKKLARPRAPTKAFCVIVPVSFCPVY
jgi:hypothetical protein